MLYDILATSKTPALIIYLLDVSASMNEKLGARRCISLRYRIGMYAYSDHVYDLLRGIKTVDQVAQLGGRTFHDAQHRPCPRLRPGGETPPAGCGGAWPSLAQLDIFSRQPRRYLRWKREPESSQTRLGETIWT
ncbi:MAG: hypothetical protein H5T62_08215 [Anaerolineae bacterium]|nr:hypothetical protein [Anaerolineae bacterium]